MRGTVLAALALALAVGIVRADDEHRQRRREIERAFAPRYMEIAVDAKRHHGKSLVRRAYARAEQLDPGDDAVIEFDPEIEGRPRRSDRKKLERLEAALAELRTEEAKARAELAVWCDDEALLDESVAEAVAALTLAPGPVSFDERGILSEPALGELPESLSLSVLDEHEVYDGRLVETSELPESVPWGRGWKLATAHFDIQTNVSGRLCRVVGRALEAAREIYAEMSGFDVTQRITVWMVSSRKQYESLWKNLGKEPPAETNIGKCYRDFCGVDGSGCERDIISVAIHEVAHGYYNLGLEARTGQRGASMPVWFHEGFATYCAGYGPDSLSYERGVVVPEIAKDKPLATFRKILEAGEAIPMDDFLNVAEGNSTFYYQAFAFFWFFYETEDEELRAGFRRAVAAMNDAALAEDRVVRGNEIFLREMGLSEEEIEARFHAWVRAGG